MKKNLVQLMLLLIVATSIAGCYPDSADSIDEYDIVFTNYDENFNFSNKKFYAIPDSVVKITGAATNGGQLEFVNQTYGNLIIQRIKSNMASRGYVLVTDTADADFVIFPSALEVTTTTYYTDYWSYYYGWYYGGGYGGWYYPYTYSTSYTTGTVLLNMIETKNVNPSDKSRVVWLAAINGLLEGSTYDYPSRINKTIDQAFSQSTQIHP